MSGRKDALTPMKEIIGSLLHDASLPFKLDDARIWQLWDEVAGETVARHAQPIWIKNGQLKIRVSDPIWLQELQFTGETIKRKLNERLGRDAIKKIEFRLGP